MRIYDCYFDGSCEKNPDGRMGMGVFIESEGEKYEESFDKPARKGNSNNVSEYMAVIRILELVKNKKKCKLNVFGDSKMVIQQLAGNWKAKSGSYIGYYHKAMELVAKVKKNNELTFIWIPRDKNKKADELSKEYME